MFDFSLQDNFLHTDCLKYYYFTNRYSYYRNELIIFSNSFYRSQIKNFELKRLIFFIFLRFNNNLFIQRINSFKSIDDLRDEGDSARQVFVSKHDRFRQHIFASINNIYDSYIYSLLYWKLFSKMNLDSVEQQ